MSPSLRFEEVGGGSQRGRTLNFDLSAAPGALNRNAEGGPGFRMAAGPAQLEILGVAFFEASRPLFEALPVSVFKDSVHLALIEVYQVALAFDHSEAGVHHVLH